MNPRLAQGIIYGSFLVSLLALLGGFVWIVQNHVRTPRNQRLAQRSDTPQSAAELPLPDVGDTAADNSTTADVPASVPPAKQATAADATPEIMSDRIPETIPDTMSDTVPDAMDSSINTSLRPDGSEPVTSVTAVSNDRQIAKLLLNAWEQLEQRQPEAVQQLIDQARPLAAGTDWASEVERLDKFHQHMQEFWTAFQHGLEGLEGTELKLKSTRVYVVEIKSQQLTLRMLGANRRFPINQLPPGLTLAIADRWFDDKAPTTPVFRGAYMAMTPPFTLEDVNGEWSQAEARGVEIGDLRQTLADRQSLPSRWAMLKTSSEP